MHKSYLREEASSILGSMIQGDVEIDDDVTHYIGARCARLRFASKVLHDKSALSRVSSTKW